MRHLGSVVLSIGLAPKNSRYWHELGDVYYNARDNTEARRCFERAIRLDGKNVRALFKAGVILAGQKKQAAALAYWRRAVKADPSYFSAHYNLGQAAQLAGKHREALKHFVGVVRLQPQDYYAGGRHRTFDMFKKEPSYEAVKKRVIAIVKKP